MPEQTLFYEVEWLFDVNGESHSDIMAQVPYQIGVNEQSRLELAYALAECTAKRMFMSGFRQRIIVGQLYPVYFADALTGQTINLK